MKYGYQAADVERFLRQAHRNVVAFHVDECLKGFESDTFSKIESKERFPLAKLIFERVSVAARSRDLNSAILVRVSAMRQSLDQVATNARELGGQLGKEDPPQMPPVIFVYKGEFPNELVKGTILCNGATLWGSEGDADQIVCFYKAPVDEDDQEDVSHDYLFIFHHGEAYPASPSVVEPSS